MGTVLFRSTRCTTELMSLPPNWTTNFCTLMSTKFLSPKYSHPTGRHSFIPIALNLSQHKCSSLLLWSWHSFARHVANGYRLFLWNSGQCQRKRLHSKTEHIRGEFLWRLRNKNQFIQLRFQHSIGTGNAVSSGSLSTQFVMWLWSVFCLYLTIWCVLARNCRVLLEIEYTYHADIFYNSLSSLCND